MGFARYGWDSEYSNTATNFNVKTLDLGCGQAVNGNFYVKCGKFVRIEKTEKNGEWIIDLRKMWETLGCACGGGAGGRIFKLVYNRYVPFCHFVCAQNLEIASNGKRGERGNRDLLI